MTLATKTLTTEEPTLTQLTTIHSRLSSILSVEDFYIFGSSLDIWGHSCRIDDINFCFNLKPDSDSDIDVGLKDYKGLIENPNLFGNRISVKDLDGRRVEVYNVIGNNRFQGTDYPYYSKETGLVYGDFERALRIYIIRKFRKATTKIRPLLCKELRELRANTFAYNWDLFLKKNISHYYDGVNFTRFTS